MSSKQAMGGGIPSRVDLFLSVVGQKSGPVKGEAHDEDHKDEIDILGWSWGMKSKTDIATGQAAGKSSLEVLKIIKGIDAASVVLMQVLRNNEVLKKVVLTARKGAGEKPLEFFTITLEGARLTSLDVAYGDASGATQGIMEHWHFSFDKIEVKYVPQGSDGEPRGAILFADSWRSTT